MTTDRQSVQAHAFDNGRRKLAGATQPDHVHGPAGGTQGLRLAADSGVFLVVGVDDHADRLARRSVHARAFRAAGRVLRAAEIFSAAPAPTRRSPVARSAARLGESSIGARTPISRNASSRSSPTSTAELPGPPTVSTHSVVLRRTRQGTPSQAESRCTPPESVSTAAAWSCNASEKR